MAQTRQRRSSKEKWRRRRRRAISLFIFLMVTIGLAWFFNSQATTTILFVRHAEVDPPLKAADDDPPLSARGRARAQLLANFLQDIDVVAGIDAIYATKFKRTQQTAAPIAKRLGLTVHIANPHKVTAFMNEVLSKHKGQIVLIVADASTIAPMIEELHGSKHVKIGPTDYDDLYIVTVPWQAKVKTLRLHYAAGWRPPPPNDETSAVTTHAFP